MQWSVKSKWIDSAVAMKIMSFFYISGGLGLSIAPKTLSKQLLRLDDATEIEQRCLRAQGKTDLINGVLVWALSIGQDFPRAMGLSCLAWIAAIIYSDFFVAGTSREAITQLLFPVCLLESYCKTLYQQLLHAHMGSFRYAL